MTDVNETIAELEEVEGDEDAEQEARDQATLEGLRQKYETQKVAFWEPEDAPRVVVAIKKGARTRQIMHRFFRDLDTKKDKNALYENLALAFVVEPGKDELLSIFEDEPVLPLRIAGRIQKMTGGSTREVGKD
jgi:hypothetical protein